MGARLLVAMVLVSTASRAEEVGSATSQDETKVAEAHLRTFSGGFSSGSYVVAPRVNVVSVGAVGFAADLGVHYRERLSVFGQFRLSSSVVMNYAQLTGSVEWSHRKLSLSLGAGAGMTVTANPVQALVIMPAVAVPVGLGLTFAEQREGTALRSTRLNLELSILISPHPTFGLGFGGTVGISVGSLVR